MPARTQMKLRRVDERDREIGIVSRSRALVLGANFRVVHILVLNAHGELLLQQIASEHDRHPGLWGSSVAGYVAHNESYSQAAKRKLKEELGINAKPKRIGKTAMQDGASRKFIELYALTWGGPITPNPDDFAALRFLSFAEIERMNAANALHVTPTFAHVLAFARQSQLITLN